MNCVTSLDAMAIQGVSAAAMGINTLRAIRDRRLGMTRLDRQQARWLKQAQLMAELGHDPVAMLGAPPIDAAPRPTAVIADAATV